MFFLNRQFFSLEDFNSMGIIEILFSLKKFIKMINYLIKNILTNNYDLDQILRTYRDHGMSRKKRYVHTVPGFNYRMTNMQAAIGTAQLGKLIDILDLRMHQEQKYKKLFFDKIRFKSSFSFIHRFGNIISN